MLPLICMAALHVFADGGNKHRPWTLDNYHQAVDTMAKPPVITIYEYLVPEFYYADSLHKGDTTLTYECYDARDSVVNTDTLRSFEKITGYALLKQFKDPDHTYTDANGQKQQLPLTFIVKRFDRLGKEKWMSVAYPGNKYSELKEDRNKIVRTDSFMENGAENNEVILDIYKYYKVAKVSH